MLKLVFSQMALIGMDKHELEFLRKHRDLFYVVPTEVKYDGQDIDLNIFTKDNKKILSEFYEMTRDANPKKFSITFPNNQKIRQDLISMKLNEYDDIVCLFPSETILTEEFKRVEGAIVQYAIGRQIEVAIANLHSISASYSGYVREAVEYLITWPNIDAKTMRDELSLIQRRKPIVQYLYAPARNMIWDEGLRNKAKDRCFGLFNFADRRGMLIVIDKRTFKGRLIKVKPTPNDFIRIIRDGSNKIPCFVNEKLTIHIHESNQGTLSQEIRDGLATAYPDTNIVYSEDLDPVTAICAGHGSVLINLEKE